MAKRFGGKMLLLKIKFFLACGDLENGMIGGSLF
jgi:hypothetical protein